MISFFPDRMGEVIAYGDSVVSTEGRRPERRDLLSTISGLS